MGKKILVDHSVFSHAKLASVINVAVAGFENKLTLLQAKPAVQDLWLRTQIEALPTVVRLVRDGRLEACSYFELMMESWRGSNFPGNPASDMFRGLNIKELQAPFNRSTFRKSAGIDLASKQSQTAFCEWILKDGETLLRRPEWLRELDEFELQALNQLPKYREICRSLSSAQLVDGWHLWTSELHRLDGFLTTDRKFARALSANKHLVLACRPIFPEDLLDEMGVQELDPMPLEYGRRYYLNGTPYD
ncbi:hypothetical protein NML43_01865 [Rhodopseudomonas palustris]|uniref:hypothetical protein n=1 Tax=Rhodopseudomonas palustris TaxID=1076 RepID=UPI0020CD9E7E|nr:hypothetical protein [Rhodopseudomonas palustris]MCP9625827.1 hypothetical protein [Rhodopseudomonas palustris]